MKFIDEVEIEVRSGDGAPGAIHFRRAKYRPRMGPDGGNGGKGGDLYLQATHQLQSLLDFKYISRYHAENGEKGMGGDCDGRSGEDLIIKVPVGTTVYDAETGDFLADLVEPDAKVLLLRGGRGGLGNMHFATPTRQAPEYAQPGEPGRSMKIRLELKLLADVALIAYPNAGKSTLISKWSAARPKIGNYPFTTLVPNLGVVRGKGVDFVLADIPGIIEGASEGKGLGHRFLRHAERTRALLMLLDLDPYTGRRLDKEYKTLLSEMKAFSAELGQRPLVVGLSKADLWSVEKPNPEALLEIDALKERGLEELFALLKEDNLWNKTFVFSSASQVGLESMKIALSELLMALGPREYKNQVSHIVNLGNTKLFDNDEEDDMSLCDFEFEFDEEE
jgi:GTP-binding protein